MSALKLKNKVDALLACDLKDATRLHLTIDTSNIQQQKAKFRLWIQDENRYHFRNIEKSFRAVSDEPWGTTLLVSRSVANCLLQTIPDLINKKLYNKIKSLTLVNTKVIPGLARAIIQALINPPPSNSGDPNGKEIEYGSNSKVTLRYLELRDCNSEFLDGREDLNPFVGLERLTLRNCVLNQSDQSKLCHYLMKYAKTSLQDLTLQDILLVSEEGVPHLLFCLPHLENLKYLHLGNSLRGVSASSLSFLAHIVEQTLPRLKYLRMNQNQNLFPDNHDFGKQPFFKSIMSRESLCFDIGNTCMNEACWIDIGESLQTTSRLKELNISGHHFTTRGIDAIAKGIAENKFLDSLDFEGCYFPPMAKLAPASTANIVSLTIDTQRNLDTAELLTCLAHSNVIEDVHLNLHDIGPETCASLANFLVTTGSLVMLTLGGLDVVYDSTVAAALSRGLRSNTSLEAIYFFVDMDEDACQILLEGMEDNYFIEEASLPNKVVEAGDFYATLNNLGRQEILDPNFPTGVLPKLYAKLENLSELYYFIRQKPLANY